MKYVLVMLVLVGSYFIYQFLSDENTQAPLETIDQVEDNKANSRIPTVTKDGITYIALSENGSLKPQNDGEEESAEIQERLEQAFRNKDNKVLQIEGTKYLLVVDLAVVRKSDIPQNSGHLIKSFTDYAVYLPPASEIIPRNQKMKAVLNTNNNMVGVIPGTIRVLLEKNANASSLLKNANLELEYTSSDIGMYYFRVKDGADIFEMANEIRDYRGVRSASIEIIESEAVPQ